jgi:hypothetical protein
MSKAKLPRDKGLELGRLLARKRLEQIGLSYGSGMGSSDADDQSLGAVIVRRSRTESNSAKPVGISEGLAKKVAGAA